MCAWSSRSNRGGNELGKGGGGLFQSGLLCPCKLNFMYVCVCVYTSQFILYIYFYDLYSPVASFFLCVCVYVCACICGKRERATMNKQYVAFPDPT